MWKIGSVPEVNWENYHVLHSIFPEEKSQKIKLKKTPQALTVERLQSLLTVGIIISNWFSCFFFSYTVAPKLSIKHCGRIFKLHGKIKLNRQQDLLEKYLSKIKSRMHLSGAHHHNSCVLWCLRYSDHRKNVLLRHLNRASYFLCTG